MGIKNLTKFINKYAPDAIKIIKNEELKGKKIAIDMSLIMHQYLFAIGDKLNYKINALHIHAVLVKTLSYLKNKIIPIFVYDGVMPDIKDNTIIKRQKNNKYNIIITKEQYYETIEILDLLGVQWIIAPTEADAQCAYLSKNNLVDYVLSEDLDLLTFGTKKLLRNYKNNSKLEISLDKILELLKINYDQFIDICILLGCDYTPTIKGLGIVKIYKFIKQYNSIQKVLMLSSFELNNIIYNISEEFKNKYTIVHNYFKNSKVKKIDIIIIKKCNKEELYNILLNKYNYEIKILDNIFKKLSF